ncbi:MAG TPA: CpaD family pilus assembly lipoprotein [Allosphingosinicella sp.]|nr:CpaD family pilus assembly lipoprotein [Allosphingosinicella sp.]
MASFKSLSLLAAAGAVLAATAAEARPRDRHGPERGIDSLNQPVVERGNYVLDLPTPSGNLTAVEKAQLRGWFDGLGVGYGDEVFVEEGYGRGPGTADVASVAAEYGLLLSNGAPVTAGSVAPGTLRVVVSRSTAYVPDCPSGATVSGPSSTSPNYGCAVNSNWAAMVANPSDLVLGQTGTVGASRDTGIKAIKVYREAPPTGTKALSTIGTSGRGN